MGKRFDLIKPLRGIVVADGKNEIGWLGLAYNCMEWSTVKFYTNRDSLVKGKMEEAREYIPEPKKLSCDMYSAWEKCVHNFNSLARFYNHQGIDVEPITTDYVLSIPTSRGNLKDRLFFKRAFRNLKRKSYQIEGLSNEEIEKRLLREGLSVRCAV